MGLVFDKTLLFGDSITQLAYNQEFGFCFGPAMQDVYNRKLDVIQRGFGGYTSNHAAIIIDRLLELESAGASKIKLLVVFFGTNDSIVPESASNNSVPVEKYQENLRKIVSAAEKVGAKVILIGPGPFNHQQFDDALGHQFEVDRTTHRAREYCNATVDVGKELGVPTVPMWDLIMEEVGWKEGDPIYGLLELPAVNPLNDYLTDGLHFSGPAYKVLFTNVLKAIKESYPELDPDNIPEHLPTWEQLTTSHDALRKAIE
ncbi:hypothetical protein TCE0_015r01963 [Talaromyces pinophilus]|uniref:SGNH hydrolase-type esterase domain-containing protein n=1 Tax=Talaromyces pinophilus TaxID=128442 RepID=A0A6V8H2Z1_TALPI|nr:hypothetical protein TCE0_015r01963 [Talaromyces pinophilus]